MSLQSSSTLWNGLGCHFFQGAFARRLRRHAATVFLWKDDCKKLENLSKILGEIISGMLNSIDEETIINSFGKHSEKTLDSEENQKELGLNPDVIFSVLFSFFEIFSMVLVNFQTSGGVHYFLELYVIQYVSNRFFKKESC